MTTQEEVIFSILGMTCSLVDGKVKVLDGFSKPFSLLEQNIELESDHEYTRLWEEHLQRHIDTMRNDLPILYEAWLGRLSTNK